MNLAKPESRTTVSVVIPIKNRADLFSETVQSLVAQTYGNWEAVVVDDGSSSNEFERISAISTIDCRIRFMRNTSSRSGASSARNTGFSASSGEFVIFLDSDDILVPGCLARRVRELEAHPAADAVVFSVGSFETTPGDRERSLTPSRRESDLDRFLRFDIPWQTMGPIWRRNSLERFYPLWDERALSWQDWEFHIRMLAADLQFIKRADVDCYWRMPSNAESIGRHHFSRRYIFNRMRLFGRIMNELRLQDALTPRRRRIVRTLAFQHAFRYGEMLPGALRLWRIAHRLDLIGLGEYLFVLACEGVRRSCEKCENTLYPPDLYLRP